MMKMFPQLRQSLRLQEAGYYLPDGTRVISYKETLYKVFRRRKRHRGHGDVPAIPQHEDDYYWEESSMGSVTESRTAGSHAHRTLISAAKYTLGFLMLLCVTFGFMQNRALQQEVNSLTNTFGPPAFMMPNFALESMGARVLHRISSDSYYSAWSSGIVDRILYYFLSPAWRRTVLQGHSLLLPGNCWCFAGSRGHFALSLSQPIYVTDITLGHMAKSQSPTGEISSAPREFSVYGMKTPNEEGTYLGTLVYDEDGPQFQTFKLPNPDQGLFRQVKLQIKSNWGHQDYTCLYRLMVHGKVPPHSPSHVF